MKDDELFFLCDPAGDVPLDDSHGLGFYYHDCRYLNGYELRLGSAPPERLGSDAGGGSWVTFELTNPDFQNGDGQLIEKECIAIKWERTLDSNACALRETIALTNSSVAAVELDVVLRLRSTFESLFEVRGAQPQRRGRLHAPSWNGSTLVFAYDGADGIRRSLTASFDPAPHATDGTAARFHVSIDTQNTATISVSLAIAETREGAGAREARTREVREVRRRVQESTDD